MKIELRKFILAICGLLVAGACVVVFLWRNQAPPIVASSEQLQPLRDFQPASSPPDIAEQLRDELGRALGVTGEEFPQKRIDLLSSFSGTLTRNERDAMLRALLEPRPANATEGWHAEYIHNLATQLQRTDEGRDEFARALAMLARNPRSGETVRDYALQHLRQVWDRADESLKLQVEASFRELAGDPMIASSALLSLHLLGSRGGVDLTQSTPSPERRIHDSEISPIVSRILAEPATAEGITDRLTVLRIVGDRRLVDFRDELRRIASSSQDEHALVRMAAIANLSNFGDPADRPFFEALLVSEPRIAHAARRALARSR